jgi:hypothetical protein
LANARPALATELIKSKAPRNSCALQACTLLASIEAKQVEKISIICT